jgi:hypothetical protein
VRTRLFLRIAAVLTLFYCGGHTSGIPWTPNHSKEADEVVTAMKTTQFVAEGVDTSYWNFYYGFGVTISVFLFASAIALWQLGAVAVARPVLARPMMMTFLVCFMIKALFAWLYFFALPAAFALIIALLILVAFVFSFREQDETTSKF